MKSHVKLSPSRVLSLLLAALVWLAVPGQESRAESSSATLQTSSPIATQFVVDAEIAGGSDSVAIVCWISGEADVSRKAEARRRPISALARLKP
ncbi:MAG: hypothetical protein AAF560_17815, partial [Acidobacteriota bacterium]